MFKIFEWITEAVGWLQIVASSVLIGLGIGALVYSAYPTIGGLVIGISIASLGLIIGIIRTIKIWKTKEGTIWYVSRVMATPELDEMETKTKEGDKNDNS